MQSLTPDEIEELIRLRRMMLKDLYMTKEQRYRWFELWQRYDR
jgi:hypothetical protein